VIFFGATGTVANLKVGDHVHVKASVNADGSLTAFEIDLQ
jgi:cell envelope opacity-associated protein A